MKPSDSKIILVTGGTGAGKTTYSKALSEKIGALRFSIDEWMTGLFWMDAPKGGTTFEWAMERITRAEDLIRQTAAQALAKNLPVVLDLGFTKSAHREAFAKWGESLGYACELHWIDIPSELRWDRVQGRNREKGDTFAMEVTRDMFDFMEDEWETPAQENWDANQFVIITD